jgi:glycosyltransferase involved in cell wall biosynthesis
LREAGGMEEKSEAPLLSIITPVYNGEKFIASCIECVARQGCNSVEHIVVDGASTDRTAAIAREHAGFRSHLKVISEPDRGQSDAQNKGIRAARADYVGILNVDDFYAPGTLCRIAHVLRTLHEPRFIYGNCNILDADDGLIFVNRPTVLKFANLLVDIETWPMPQNPSAYFYPKSLHDVVGYYDLDEHFVMDLKFILAAIQKIEPLYIDEILGNMRHLPGTKTVVSAEDGTLPMNMRRVFLDAFMRSPFRTKLRVASLWVRHKPRRTYWNLRRKFLR